MILFLFMSYHLLHTDQRETPDINKLEHKIINKNT